MPNIDLDNPENSHDMPTEFNMTSSEEPLVDLLSNATAVTEAQIDMSTIANETAYEASTSYEEISTTIDDSYLSTEPSLTEQEIIAELTTILNDLSSSDNVTSTDISTETNSIHNDTPTTPSTTHLTTVNIPSTTEAATTTALTDPSDRILFGRSLDPDNFLNYLTIILKNPAANIQRYNLKIAEILDELCTQQALYGISESFFEPLHKLGEAFRRVYPQDSRNQAVVDRYFEFIAPLEKNLNSTRLNCSSEPTLNTLPTTTLPSTAPTTPINTFNTTQQNNTDTNPINTTPTSRDEIVSTHTLNSQLVSLGLVAAAQGAMAGMVHGVTASISQQFESRGYLKGWRKPIAQAGVMLANAAAISTLPLFLYPVEDESEQSNSFNKALLNTAYSFGSSLLLQGVTSAAHWTYSYFNQKPLSKDSMGSKALDALPLLAHAGLLVTGGYPISEAAVIIGANTVTAGLANSLTQFTANTLSNNIKKITEKDVEMGAVNNNIEMLPVAKNALSQKDNNRSVVHPNTLFNNNLHEFIKDFSSKTKDFKFESKNFTTENKYSFARLNLIYGTDNILSIFNPADIKQNPANASLLFAAINELADKLANNKSTTSLKFLFVLPLESTTAVVEIAKYPNSSKSRNKITIYIEDILFKKEISALKLTVKQHNYVFAYKTDRNYTQYRFERNNSFAIHSIKNSIKDYLQACLLPNNAFPRFLEGLLATFIYKLEKNSDLKFELQKLYATENIKESNLEKIDINPQDTPQIAAIAKKRTEQLTTTLERKRDNALAACLSISKNNKILSIFKPIPPDDSPASKSPRIEVLKHLLEQRQSDIKRNNSDEMRDLLPLLDEKGITVIEIITAKYLSKSYLLIHDPLQVLKNSKAEIKSLAKQYGYQYQYNSSDYSADWKSAERCQLAVYHFIKEATFNHLEYPNQSTSELINPNKNIPSISLAEVKQNLSLNDKFDIHSLPEIKRCDRGKYDIRDFISYLISYVNVLTIDVTSPLDSKETKVYSANQRSSFFKPTTPNVAPNSSIAAPVLPSHSRQGYK
jgi:hypothetical protein